MYYTGVGSRSTPTHVAIAQNLIAGILAKLGYTLRSGHADGSDINFERGAYKVSPSKTAIYLPWKGFRSDEDLDQVKYYCLNDKAFQWARKQLNKSGVIPYFDDMTDVNKAFHARNVFQIFGKEKVPSDFVVYYAPLCP